MVDDVRRFMKTEMFERVVHLRRGAGEARENPAVDERHFAARGIGRGSAHIGRRQASNGSPPAVSYLSRFMNTNRAAFQILLANAR